MGNETSRWIENFLADLVTSPQQRHHYEREREEALRRSAHRHQKRTPSKKKTTERLDDLEDWLGELTLLNETTMRLLLAKKVFTKAELLKEIDTVDLLDGEKDGKLIREKAPAKKKSAPPKKKSSSGSRRRR